MPEFYVNVHVELVVRDADAVDASVQAEQAVEAALLAAGFERTPGRIQLLRASAADVVRCEGA